MDRIEIIKRAIKKAMQSNCKMRIAAFGFNKRGEFIASTTNKTRFSRKGGGLHAERILMSSARKKGITNILIFRIGKSGDLLPIDPCYTCKRIADKLNIKIQTI